MQPAPSPSSESSAHADQFSQQSTTVRPQLAFKTDRGRLYVGDSLKLLQSPAFERLKGKVQLIFTSPPFPLARKKRYGNLVGDDYSRWLAEFAKPLRDL